MVCVSPKPKCGGWNKRKKVLSHLRMADVVNQFTLHVHPQIFSVFASNYGNNVCNAIMESNRKCTVLLIHEMVSRACVRKWPLFLWSLSALISSRTPFSCGASSTEKGSIFVSDENVFRRNYRLEDFFWTGSGDGPVGENLLNNETDAESQSVYDYSSSTTRTSTIFHTATTLYATIYPNSESCYDSECKPKISPVWTTWVEFSSPVSTPYHIEPTPTWKYSVGTTKPRNLTIVTEVTKVFTVTERVTEGGKTLHISPTKTVFRTIQTVTVLSRNHTGDDNDVVGAGEGSGAAFPRFDIELNTTVTTIHPNLAHDQKFWLLTVLKCDTSNGVTIRTMEEKLSSLYTKAFIRQQEKHLGINGNSITTTRPRRDKRIPEPVAVHIHNVTDVPSKDSNGVALLYSVTVAGKPVPALTAANDMRLVTLSEVVAELGYPVLTKAEPYLKEVMPLGARVKGRSRDTWLLIGAVIAAVSLLIILAAVFTFGLSDRKEDQNKRGTTNKKHIFEAEEGSSNLAFQEDPELKIKIDGSKYENIGTPGVSSGATVTFADQRRGSSSSSSCSGSSEASLVRLRYQQKKRDQRKEISGEKQQRPRTRIRRIQSGDATLEETFDSHILNRSACQTTGVTAEGVEDVQLSPRTTRTPTSYLSMPSVKAFPRGARIPEPLSRVLEPISIRYLDGDPDNSQRALRRRVLEENTEADFLHTRARKLGKDKGMTRHASLEGDPGVVGPLVWKGEYLKNEHFGKDVLGILEIDGNINVGKMRKRFNDLIDDAFSAFGNKNECAEGQERCGADLLPNRSSDSRIHSAVIRPVESFSHFSSSSRPKTTDSKRALAGTINQGPRGAWDSPNYSTPLKQPPESAFIDKSSILVDSNLSPGDPAIPLIKAIKDELQKFDQESGKLARNTVHDS